MNLNNETQDTAVLEKTEDIDPELKSTAEKQPQPAKEIVRKTGVFSILKKGFLFLLFLVILVFALQNASVVNVRLLGWEVSVFLSIGLLLSYFIGLVSGWINWKLLGR